MTAPRPSPPPTAARRAYPERRRQWPAWLLALGLGSLPLVSPAQELPDAINPARDAAPGPTPSPPKAVGPPYTHHGWYFGGEIGLGTATAGGDGKYYSLESLNGGRSVTPWSLGLRLGHTLRPDLRLGVAFGAVYSKSTDGGLESTAMVSHVGAELSWHPRGDGAFVRGELGLGILQANGDITLDTSGRDINRTGPAVTLGGGYLFGWHHLGIAHFAVSSDLSWAHYGGSTAPGSLLTWSLAWTARIGVDVW